MNIILDYDGTLHNCLLIYAPAFRGICRILAAEGLMPRHEYTDAEIGSWLGLPSAEMWQKFAPNLPAAQRKRASRYVYTGMIDDINSGRAKLYPGAAKVLQDLKAAGHKLFFLSNCEHKYMEAHRAAFNLNAYFEAMYCAEDCGWRTKAEIFPDIAAAYPGDYLMIGDRHHDIEVAVRHNLPSIGCAYGYGAPEELAAASYIAQSVEELPGLVAKIAAK